MTKKTITITDISELRAGDIATFKIDGREYTGPAYEDANGNLMFAELPIRWIDGAWGTYAEFLVSATREVEAPQLPTEPLSVITNVTTKYGDMYPLAVLAGGGIWQAFSPGKGHAPKYRPESIVWFELAKVVAADA